MEAKNLHCPQCGASLTVKADSAGQLQVTLQAAEAHPSPLTPPPPRSSSRKALDRLAKAHGELENLIAYESRHVAEKERAAGRGLVQGLAFLPVALGLALSVLFILGRGPRDPPGGHRRPRCPVGRGSGRSPNPGARATPRSPVPGGAGAGADLQAGPAGRRDVHHRSALRCGPSGDSRLQDGDVGTRRRRTAWGRGARGLTSHAEPAAVRLHDHLLPLPLPEPHGQADGPGEPADGQANPDPRRAQDGQERQPPA